MKTCKNCGKELTHIQIIKKAECCSKGCATSFRQKADDPDLFEYEDKDFLYYVLGLIWSDGNLNKEEDKITFCFKDQEFVEYLYNKICDTQKHKIYEFHKKDFISYGFINTNKNFINKCKKFGLVSNKSKIITYTDIPQKYQYSFIRGIFDGDGSVYVHNRYKGTNYLGVTILSANKNFLIPLQQILTNNNIESNLLLDWRGSVYMIKIYKKESIKNFYNFIYKNSLHFLPRKKEVFIINDIV